MNQPAAKIELRLRHLNQLFNSLDPSPFYEQDLDDDAEEFIVGWARELPREPAYEIVIHLGVTPTGGESNQDVCDSVCRSVQRYFSYRAQQEGRRLSELLRVGRFSLLVGLAFLAICFSIANLLGDDTEPQHPMLKIFRESLIIVGWVALWRPLEIFLYDWWPINRHRRLYQKLSRAHVALLGPEDRQASVPSNRSSGC